jgi:tetrahydromethanopterin S-methyltransferase subunit D
MLTCLVGLNIPKVSAVVAAVCGGVGGKGGVLLFLVLNAAGGNDMMIVFFEVNFVVGILEFYVEQVLKRSQELFLLLPPKNKEQVF